MTGIDRSDILDIDDDDDYVIDYGDVQVNLEDQWAGKNVRNYICRSTDTHYYFRQAETT